MPEALSSLPPLSAPLLLGLSGTALALAGSVLRLGLRPTPRKVGGYCCVFGLILMAAGFLCITSGVSLLDAHRV